MKDLAWHSWQLQAPVWKVSEGLKRLKGLKGASGSFGPVEKERLGLPQLAAPRKVSEGLKRLKGASCSCGPVLGTRFWVR